MGNKTDDRPLKEIVNFEYILFIYRKYLFNRFLQLIFAV